MIRNPSSPDIRHRAHQLLPDVAAQPAPARGWNAVATVIITTLVTLLVLALVSVGTWQWTTRDRSEQQYAVSAPALPAGLAADAVGSAMTAPATAAPIVLTYHDVTAVPSTSIYKVAAASFAGQMKVLHDAGYKTLTAAQFLAYSRGGVQPHRSVLITFDDGTAGDYTYADQILKQYDFHAVAFMITGRIGTHAPYYLSWKQMQRMHASGRWDFESHTHDLHEKAVVGPDGRLGSRLTNQVYLNGRRQTLAAFKAEVTADLRASITDLTSHRLPRPTMFAYPFSEVAQHAPDIATAAFTQNLVQRLFPLSFVDHGSGPMPASR